MYLQTIKHPLLVLASTHCSRYLIFVVVQFTDGESQDDTDTPMEAQNMNDSGVDETIVDTTRPPRQVPTVSRTPDLNQYRSESARLQTFRSWTHPYPRPADLANAGFIFAGK